ncbi:hypothetical protein KIPB_006865 [Kipferlia bialata]|uniref:Uncharacterized protein n=1 Tax=Kipferlia bialata TaxID=797122 RepID=A0A9K3GII9_9EUKA|nr:hypothetical protein KIPB_006865 [Kipferlia bialata]|eukprot:g6865.t1
MPTIPLHPAQREGRRLREAERQRLRERERVLATPMEHLFPYRSSTRGRDACMTAEDTYEYPLTSGRVSPRHFFAATPGLFAAPACCSCPIHSEDEPEDEIPLASPPLM